MDKIEIVNEILEYLSFGYRIKSIIKVSGQRSAYLGTKENSGLGKVVIKICDYHPSIIPRIQRELRILNELKSPYFPKSLKNAYITLENIATFIDNLNPEDDRVKIDEINKMHIYPFFVTVEEYIEHIPWPEAAKKLKKEEEIVKFLIEIFSALKLLWDDKIAHRDLKPDNILVSPDMKPVIIDLGIAKSFRDGTQALTRSIHMTPCTPCYASPEQLSNAKDEINYKSDQFSIGVIAVEILAGEFPYGNYQVIGDAKLLRNIREGRLIDIKGLNPRVSNRMCDFLKRLLAAYPYQRYRRPEDILNELYQMNH